ncbi:MAG: hypothetical protein ACRC28_06255 [Clostridium sp.]|uniref:hypothetical protein n=1 Tax=Clostridia TaxID=186801 RepID=UPI003F3446D6
MSIEVIKDFINTTGFPIALSIGLILFIYKLWKEQKKTLEYITNTNKSLVDTNKELVDKLVSKVDNIENKVDEIIEINKRRD